MPQTHADATQASRVEQNTRGARLSQREIQLLVGSAEMAPSVLNTQPWAFRADGVAIDVIADPSRGLHRSIDPIGRQLVVSCGAALLNLRVAAAHLGRASAVQAFPDDTNPTVLATVTFGPPDAIVRPDADLYPQIRRRHTHRRPFEARTVPGTTLAELIRCASVEQASLTFLGPAERHWLFDLISLSETELAESTEYEAALSAWASGSPSRFDGVPATAFGTLPWADWPPMRSFSRVHAGKYADRETYPKDPAVAVLATSDDDPASWLCAGQALQRVLLTGCQRGLAASFLNQPLDVPEIRRDMEHRGWHGLPQMIMRLGYARGDVSTPRRPLEEVLRPPETH
jgi:hypothetical protein